MSSNAHSPTCHECDDDAEMVVTYDDVTVYYCNDHFAERAVDMLGTEQWEQIKESGDITHISEVSA